LLLAMKGFEWILYIMFGCNRLPLFA